MKSSVSLLALALSACLAAGCTTAAASDDSAAAQAPAAASDSAEDMRLYVRSRWPASTI